MGGAEREGVPGVDSAVDSAVDSDVDSITAVAQDYLKAIWSATEWGDPPVTTKALAARFGTTAANVTDTMKRLSSQGLLSYEPYKAARLTDVGARLAVEMVRRHRLIETFLVTTLGYPWDQVHDEAERLEHAATARLIDRIDAQLGHPEADPHGDPIPTAAGRVRSVDGAVRLGQAGSGRYVVRRVSDSEPDDLAEAARLGLLPGTIVGVDVGGDGEGLGVSTASGRLRVSASLAAACWVTAAR